MALQKITKRAVKGSLLIQYKFSENSGSWIHSTNSNQFTTIDNSPLTITPLYATSIMEISASFVMGDVGGGTNTLDTYAAALFANGINEYEQNGFHGLTPYGNTFSHHGGRNDRLNTSHSRYGSTSNFRSNVALTHAYIPRVTNAITFEVKVRNENTDRDVEVRDFYMIAKEIAIPEDRVKSGSVTHDGV